MTTEDLIFYMKEFGIVLSLLGLCILAIWSPRVKRHGFRLSIRIAGVIALLPTFFVFSFLLLIPRYTSVATLTSPDGRFICYVKGGGSGATVDWTSITLRRTWRPFAQVVYYTQGAFDPQVNWKDAKTLVIRYPEHDDPMLCKHVLADINLECKSAPRNEFYPLETYKQ